MVLSKAEKKKLGNLADESDRKLSDLIIDRGGNSSNVRQAGHWADKSLGEVAQAAANGVKAAEMAIKIVKQAKRLGKKH